MPDLELHIHHRTAQAVLVSDDGDEDRAVWLALSKVDYEGELKSGSIKVFDVPSWIAEEKGLV